MNTKKKTLQTIFNHQVLEREDGVWELLYEDEILAEIQALIAEAIPEKKVMITKAPDHAKDYELGFNYCRELITKALVERGLLAKGEDNG